MAEAGAAPVKTFSIGFEEQEYDELPYARLVARAVRHRPPRVRRPAGGGRRSSRGWSGTTTSRIADSSAIPTFYLSELTRRHVTVALNGDGGDENFAGYAAPPGGPARRAVRAASPAPSARPLAARARGPSRRRGAGWPTRAGSSPALGEPPARRYARWASHLDPALKRELHDRGVPPAAGDRDSLEHAARARSAAAEGTDLLDATLAADVETYLPDDLLVKVDIATMAHGLEGRSPFLDHDVMEFCASLPSDLKLRGLDDEVPPEASGARSSCRRE